MRLKTMTAVLLATAALLPSCKTTEANYREAYEKTVAARNADQALDSTIYGAHRRQMTATTVETADGAVEVRVQLVRVAEGGGGIPENLKRFNVVVGQFKQIFNARSLRNRIADKGYPGAFVVETSEPFYFVVAASYHDATESSTAVELFKHKRLNSMKEPCPFILDATARRRQTTSPKK
ncbi:MAG: SPOR domain-containing protein [Muribaculaceae bacterium]|nr:SPOR domain-containing protein [Muribaculaceae bacterium]